MPGPRAALCLALWAALATPAHTLELEARLHETGESGVLAKEKAMAGAAEAAFRDFIVSSIASRNQIKARDLIRANEARLVESIFVESEIIAPGSYTAQLRFVIREGVLRQILAEAKISFVTGDAPPVLVVPYERVGGELVLDAEGAWFRLWQERAAQASRAPVLLPGGSQREELFDEVTLAMPLEEQAFFLGVRFGVRSVAFAILDTGDEEWLMHLEGEDAIGPLKETVAIEGLRGAPGAGMTRAVADAALLLEDRWKDAAAQPLAAMEDIRQRVRVPLLHGTGEWAGVEHQLRHAAGVRRLDLTHLAETHAEADLFIVGGTEEFLNALEREFVVLQAEDGVLVLRPLMQ